MVADVTEAAVANVIAAAIFKAQVHALRRGRAMNNEQGNRAHSYLQAPNPKAPAMAVATVMITLRTIVWQVFRCRKSLQLRDAHTRDHSAGCFRPSLDTFCNES